MRLYKMDMYGIEHRCLVYRSWTIHVISWWRVIDLHARHISRHVLASRLDHDRCMIYVYFFSSSRLRNGPFPNSVMNHDFFNDLRSKLGFLRFDHEPKPKRSMNLLNVARIFFFFFCGWTASKNQVASIQSWIRTRSLASESLMFDVLRTYARLDSLFDI